MMNAFYRIHELVLYATIIAAMFVSVLCCAVEEDTLRYLTDNARQSSQAWYADPTPKSAACELPIKLAGP